MRFHVWYATLAAGALATLTGSAMAPAPEEKKDPRPGGPPHHVVTVRYGNTPVTDRKARKLVHIIDQEGKGVEEASIGFDTPAGRVSYVRTGKDGVAEIKTDRGNVLISADGVQVILDSRVTRFPIEVVVTRKEDHWEKAPERRPGGRLHHLFTVRYGSTPATDKEARKVVRVIDRKGRGVKDARIVLGFHSSMYKQEFRTDKDGVADLSTGRTDVASSVTIYAGPVRPVMFLRHKISSGSGMMFPIEVVVSEATRK